MIDGAGSSDAAAAVLSHEDLLHEILLRVRPATALIPACAVCRAWRRILRSRAFWRLFFASSSPPLLGFYHNCDFSPRPPFTPVLPSPLAPLERLRSVDFNLSMLPGEAWEIRDSRDGLLLLFRPDAPGAPLVLVVYNPLTSHCLCLPSPTEEKNGVSGDGDDARFLSSVFQHDEYLFDAALVTDGQTDGASLAPAEFRVILVVSCFRELIIGAWLFSSVDYRWRVIGYANIPVKPWFPGVVTIPSVNGVFYWVNRGDYVLRINFDSRKLSIIELSKEMSQCYGTNIEIVGTEEDIALLGAHGKELHLWVLALNRSGDECWKLKKTFDLQHIVDTLVKEKGDAGVDSLIILEGIGERGGLVFIRIVDQIYSLNLKAEKLELVSTDTKCQGFSSFPFMMSWPPFMISDEEGDL